MYAKDIRATKVDDLLKIHFSLNLDHNRINRMHISNPELSVSILIGSYPSHILLFQKTGVLPTSSFKPKNVTLSFPFGINGKSLTDTMILRILCEDVRVHALDYPLTI